MHTKKISSASVMLSSNNNFALKLLSQRKLWLSRSVLSATFPCRPLAPSLRERRLLHSIRSILDNASDDRLARASTGLALMARREERSKNRLANSCGHATSSPASEAAAGTRADSPRHSPPTQQRHPPRQLTQKEPLPRPRLGTCWSSPAFPPPLLRWLWPACVYKALTSYVNLCPRFCSCTYWPS